MIQYSNLDTTYIVDDSNTYSDSNILILMKMNELVKKGVKNPTCHEW